MVFLIDFAWVVWPKQIKKYVNDHSDVIQKHIDKSLSLEQIAGPFLDPPFIHSVLAPLGKI